MASDLRVAQPNDVDGIHEIELTAFSDPWSRSAFFALFGREEVIFDVAVAQGRIAGYLIAYAAGGESELANVAVAPWARRAGVGRALLDRCFQAAQDRGAVEMWLEVRSSNRAAKALYENAGFVEVGTRKKYYREPVEDALVMHRDLALEGAR